MKYSWVIFFNHTEASPRAGEREVKYILHTHKEAEEYFRRKLRAYEGFPYGTISMEKFSRKDYPTRLDDRDEFKRDLAESLRGRSI
jgi:hypothetical protein